MLSILGLVAVIIATYHAYKSAKDTERNAIGWALLTFGVGFGIQIVIPVIIGIVIAIVMLASGNSIVEVEGFAQSVSTIIGIVCLFLSFIGIWFILRYVSKIPEYDASMPPPPPPTFDGQ